MNEEFDWDLESILKRLALWGGIALAIISIYFSYDGADQTINGGNPAYTEVAKYIMVIMAIVITLAQFIFNSDFSKLSATMKIIGALSYVYSLTTNYMGIQHLFGFHGLVGAMIAGFMDIAPEAFIAWALDDALRGDMLGNLGKMFMGVGHRAGRRDNRNRNQNQNKQYASSEPVTQPKMPVIHNNQGKHGKGREFHEKQRKEKNNNHPGPFGGNLFGGDE